MNPLLNQLTETFQPPAVFGDRTRLVIYAGAVTESRWRVATLLQVLPDAHTDGITTVGNVADAEEHRHLPDAFGDWITVTRTPQTGVATHDAVLLKVAELRVQLLDGGWSLIDQRTWHDPSKTLRLSAPICGQEARPGEDGDGPVGCALDEGHDGPHAEWRPKSA